MTLKTFVAVDRLVLCWLEWNFTFLATISTGRFVHFSISSVWHVITTNSNFSR